MKTVMILVLSMMTAACAVQTGDGADPSTATSTREASSELTAPPDPQISCSQTFCNPYACAVVSNGFVDCEPNSGADLQCQLLACDGSTFSECDFDKLTADLIACRNRFGKDDASVASCMNGMRRHCIAQNL